MKSVKNNNFIRLVAFCLCIASLLISCINNQDSSIASHEANNNLQQSPQLETTKDSIAHIGLAPAFNEPDSCQHINRLLGAWVSTTTVGLCSINLKLKLVGDSLTFTLDTESRTERGTAIFSYDKQTTWLELPIEWEINKGDLTQKSASKKALSRPELVRFYFDCSHDKLSIQNYGNAMNHYVQFKDCDRKYIDLIRHTQTGSGE